MADGDRAARALLAAGAAAGIAVLVVGLALQHGLGMQPCAWCVLQRLLFLLVAAACALGAWVPGRGARIGAALAADGLASAGAAAALWQHFVASSSDQCGVSFADKVIMALSLHEIAPWMFLADAPCSEANMPFLGVPFALWSLAAFLLLGLGAGTALVMLLRRR